MSPFIYAINIGTLAIWLSVAAFGTVGIVIPVARGIWYEPPVGPGPEETIESTLFTGDFTAGELPSLAETNAAESEVSEDTTPLPAEEETLPAPPDMPETAEATPLPEVPDLPALSAKPSPSKPQSASRPSRPTTSGSTTQKSGTARESGSGGSTGGSSMSDASRLAGGRMAPPSYPSAARSRGQEGTVIVEFVVGENGRVTSAHAKSPSPWPLLNNSAVNCVRTWRFPPGKVSRYVRPIVFKLN